MAWRIADITKREQVRLQGILDNGFPKVYQTPTGISQSYWFDFFPDFSWRPDELAAQLVALSQDPQWLALAEQVDKQHGVNFVAEVLKALADPDLDPNNLDLREDR